MKKLPFAPYTVSKDGQTVYSLISGKTLKQHIQKLPNNKTGYKQVFLKTDNGKSRWFKVHRLVALLYIQNPQRKPEVNHKDGNKHNNHYLNLEWSTHSENIKHSYKELNRKAPQPMKGKTHKPDSKQKMSLSKQGTNHPKFRGYFYYNNNQYTSIRQLCIAEHISPSKAKRLQKDGQITFIPK